MKRKCLRVLTQFFFLSQRRGAAPQTSDTIEARTISPGAKKSPTSVYKVNFSLAKEGSGARDKRYDRGKNNLSRSEEISYECLHSIFFLSQRRGVTDKVCTRGKDKISIKEQKVPTSVYKVYFSRKGGDPQTSDTLDARTNCP